VRLVDKDGEHVMYEFDPSRQDHLDAFGGAKDMQGQITHFIECIQTGQQPVTHGREGIKAMQVGLAATAAEEEKQTLNVQEFVNRPENTAPWEEAKFRGWVKDVYGWTEE